MPQHPANTHDDSSILDARSSVFIESKHHCGSSSCSDFLADSPALCDSKESSSDRISILPASCYAVGDTTLPLHSMLSHSTILLSTNNYGVNHLSFSAHNNLIASIPDRSESKMGVEFISAYSDYYVHHLLLTYSGEVYSWGYNDQGQVLFDGPRNVTSPIKLPLYDIVTISAGREHSLALSSEGKLFGWGGNCNNQINKSNKLEHYSLSTLPITPITTAYKIKEIYSGEFCSFALTQEGQVIKWGYCKSFEIIKDLNNIVFISIFKDSVVAVDENGHFFCTHYDLDSSTIVDYSSDGDDNLFNYDFFITTKIPVTQYITPKEPFKGSFLIDDDCFLVIDFNGDIWKFSKGDDVLFNNKPTKIPGLSNIVSISGCYGIHATLDKNGKVFVWGELSSISDVYEDSEQPICIDAFTNIEGISVGRDFLFAYNKNTVWAWGRNFQGQLGTGDLINRPQPVKVFGSEILGSFHYPKQPLNRMFSGLIKLVYWEYLNYLVNLFGSHPYVKARFYTKCGISKRVAQFAQEVFNVHPIQNQMLLKDPQDLNLNEIICESQLRFSTYYNGPKVINTRIKKLDVYFDEVDYDPELLSFSPNVEVVKLGRESSYDEGFVLNLAHLTNLKCLELNCSFIIETLPTSLVKLVFDSCGTRVDDLSYLTSLEELVVYARYLASFESILLEGLLALPQTIVRLEVELHKIGNIEIQLPNLKELLIHGMVPTNITEQNFPSLKFIQLIQPDEDSLSDCTLSPTKLINQGLIKSVKLIKSEYLVEFSCFPWWIQYSTERFLVDIFCKYLD
ncbi:hypothetical protein P9112_006031 [Eukaryota sp. TZLM1-RC]